MPTSQWNSELFRKRWSALPIDSYDRNFWTLLGSFCAPFLSTDPSPYEHEEFFSLRSTGRNLDASVECIRSEVLEACSTNRASFDTFSLWNPYALAALLQVSINTVVEQLLLAVEKRWMELHFVVCCVSCGYDITHCSMVSELNVGGPRYTPKAFRCPMCTDTTEIHSLSDIYVFFRLKNLPSAFLRDHYRLSWTSVAEKQRLESIFCPAGARFAVTLQLPEGRYLLVAPFIAALLELEVTVGFEKLPPRERNIIQTIDLKKYILIRAKDSEQEAKLDFLHKASPRSTYLKRATIVSTSMSQYRNISVLRSESLAGRRNLLMALRTNTMRTNSLSYTNGNGAGFCNYSGTVSEGLGEEVDALVETPIQLLTLKHGKVKLIFYNDTASSGFLDLFVAFERWAEFAADVYPTQLTVSEFLHYVPRGPRSNFIRRCVPKPPTTIPTDGIFVRHSFDLSYNYFKDPCVVSVIQEVHRYSLEDHSGLLLTVSNGGTLYDSSFISITAAIASSMCFFQRVLLRLGDDVALSMRCSINNAPLHLTTYHVQYNDADNMRSAYPDAQFVGPAVYHSSHPSIIPPTLYAFEQELPRTVVKQTEYEHKVLNYDPFELTKEEQRNLLLLNSSKEKSTMIRFEIRNFSDPSSSSESRNNFPFKPRETPRKSTVRSSNSLSEQEPPLSVSFEESIPEVNDTADLPIASNIGKFIKLTAHDALLPYFLNYLCEHLEGTTIVRESHTFVILVPLLALQASVQLPTLLDRSWYLKMPSGPF